MHFFTFAAASLSLFSSAFAAPSGLKDVLKYTGKTNSGSFIVKYKDGVVVKNDLNLGAGANVTHGNWDKTFFNGFAAQLDQHTLNTLRADPNVAWIEEDGIMHTSNAVTQNDAPWGISRLSQDNPQDNQDPTTNDFTYTFDSSAGKGVDIYVIDTGINVNHVEFGGRAKFAKAIGGLPATDDNGHGTHCAGTAAGKRFGVAKNANLFAVKVLDARGSGATSNIISGMNFVAGAAKQSGRPSVASMSFGGAPSKAIDTAVEALVGAGVHCSVAAGNEAQDAGNTSPARVPAAVTVGAHNIQDTVSRFSNFGKVVDIFAPGERVTSSFIGSNTALKTLDGTSMAAPHVSGLIASLISTGGNLPPAEMEAQLKSLAISGRLAGVRSGSPNLLARNDQ